MLGLFKSLFILESKTSASSLLHFFSFAGMNLEVDTWRYIETEGQSNLLQIQFVNIEYIPVLVRGIGMDVGTIAIFR